MGAEKEFIEKAKRKNIVECHTIEILSQHKKRMV
jgi:hypothetical protein